MVKTMVGKIAVIKDGCSFDGHWGVVIGENREDNEYLIAGGSLSVLTPDGVIKGGAPLLLREDFVVPRQLDERQSEAVDAFWVYQKAKTSWK
ncbi:hypothetical protein AB4254_12195 [Vibrio breoganii]